MNTKNIKKTRKYIEHIKKQTYVIDEMISGAQDRLMELEDQLDELILFIDDDNAS